MSTDRYAANPWGTGRGPWMQVYRGVFHPREPMPEEIDIEVVAHALSMLCRFNGHTTAFYSVAEHCCKMFDALEADYQPWDVVGWALFHDAAEAYIGDMIRPMKAEFDVYYDWERRILRAIATKVGLPWPMPKLVTEADTRILKDERDQAITPLDVPDAEWGCPLPALGVKLNFWSPEEGKAQFLRRYRFWCHMRNFANDNRK